MIISRKNISLSLKIVKASNCNMILFKRFLVQFYLKESQFHLINNEKSLKIGRNPNKNMSLCLKRR